MHRLFRIKAYEAEHGPHFDEEMARKAVSKMENEDGSRGQHWSIEETTSLANQHGIRMDEKFNKYDWYVALNMVYSDYYRVIVNMTNSNNPKHFVELAKAWMCDKDIEEGKMWYYYVYIMCDKIRNAEEELYEREYGRRHKEDDDDDDEYEYHGMMRRGGRRSGMTGRRSEYNYDRDYEREERNREYEIVEVLGTFKKNTSYSVGTVSSVSNVYDEALPQGQFQMPGQTRKRLVDVVITSDGESKKFTVPVDRSIISDSSIGLTISTNKNEIVKIIQDQYNIYKAKKDSIAKCDEEMKRCQDLLDKLDIKPEEKEDPRIKELQNEVSELKNIIKQASQMVPAPMKQMLPQDMQNAMNEASH